MESVPLTVINPLKVLLDRVNQNKDCIPQSIVLAALDVNLSISQLGTRDLSDQLTLIEVGLQALGMNWKSDRVQAYIKLISDREGRKIRGKHDLPPYAIDDLAAKLQKLMEEKKK
jgi:hypothetical protein